MKEIQLEKEKEKSVLVRIFTKTLNRPKLQFDVNFNFRKCKKRLIIHLFNEVFYKSLRSKK